MVMVFYKQLDLRLLFIQYVHDRALSYSDKGSEPWHALLSGTFTKIFLQYQLTCTCAINLQI